MTFKQYQKKALSTATYRNSKVAIICASLGLNGEFTEFRDNPVPQEMGDVWWYYAVLAYHLDIQPSFNRDRQSSKKTVISTIGKIQEIIKKSYRDHDLDFIVPQKRFILENLMDELYTALYFWSMTVVSDTKAESCAELVWHMNILKLKDRQERNVLHGSGDNR